LALRFWHLLPQKDCFRRADEGEREKNAASTVDNLGKIRPVVGREFVVSITSMSERKTSSELARMKRADRAGARMSR
jgi:hypothetical protein